MFSLIFFFWLCCHLFQLKEPPHSSFNIMCYSFLTLFLLFVLEYEIRKLAYNTSLRTKLVFAASMNRAIGCISLMAAGNT